MSSARLRVVALATVLLSGASCGSTEPAISDGEFRASMTGSFERPLAGTAVFSVEQFPFTRIVLEMTDRFPGPTADGEQWGVFFALPPGTTPGPNDVFAMTSATNIAVSLVERSRTNGTILGYDWTVTSGELRVQSSSKGLFSGTFSLAARRTFGTETVTITGSFRALCPGPGALAGIVCE